MSDDAFSSRPFTALRLRLFRPLGRHLLTRQLAYCGLAGLCIALLQIGFLLAERRPAHIEEILRPAAFILISQALGSLLLAWLMAGLFRRRVGAPLEQLARQLGEITPGGDMPKLTLPRRRGAWRDEFDLLCQSYNALNGRLFAYLEAQRQMEAELRANRDGLAALVARRTGSLERLRDFHSLVIGMLTRFMNLPPEQAERALEQGLAAFCRFFDVPRCLLFTLDEASRGFRIAHAWPRIEGDSAAVNVMLASDALEQHTRGARGARIWLTVKAGDNHDAGSDEVLTLLDASACTIVGVEVMHRTVGLLCLAGQAHAPEGEDARLLELGARVTATMLDHQLGQARLREARRALEAANQELHQLSRYDPLTGLANRRRFDEVKAKEFSRALRAQQPLAVLMVDIDHFKAYNDSYGHAQGDRCLQSIADILQQHFARAGELPARMGGEEFAVLLPGSTREPAQLAAERLRIAVFELGIPHLESSVARCVTISVGVACFNPLLHDAFDDLLADADRALYIAKRQRNHVSLAE